MNFKQDEEVKANLFDGEDKVWCTAIFKSVQELEKNLKYNVSYHGKSYTVREADICRFVRINDSQIEEFGKKNIDDLTGLITKVSNILGIERLVGNVATTSDFSVFGSVEIGNGRIVIFPTFQEFRRIGVFEEQPCWGIGIAQYSCATFSEPESREVLSKAFIKSNPGTTFKALQLLFEYDLDACLESLLEVFDAYEEELF